MSSDLNAVGRNDAASRAEVPDADARIKAALAPLFREANAKDRIAGLFLLAAGMVGIANMTPPASQHQDGQQMHQPAPEKLLPAQLDDREKEHGR